MQHLPAHEMQKVSKVPHHGTHDTRDEEQGHSKCCGWRKEADAPSVDCADTTTKGAGSQGSCEKDACTEGEEDVSQVPNDVCRKGNGVCVL